MATVINNPNSEDSSGIGMLVGIVLAVLVIILFFVYGLPAIRNSNTENPPNDINVNVDLPDGGTGGGNGTDTGGGSSNY